MAKQRGFWATLAVVIGLLWMTLSGLCTTILVVSILTNGSGAFLLGVWTVAIGGFFFGMGWLIWSLGRGKRAQEP